MAIFKCKMCGGALEITEGITVAECEYCGTQQTVPTADNEKKMNLFTRANRLRAACEFDKAASIYESIVAEFSDEAEAYWGLVLCEYGIEYIDDPATGKKIPTCHRSSFESVMKNSNVELAQECADPIARKLYRDEAKQIEELRKNIISVSEAEEPYDIFICYKETDFDGKRTLDSVLAQDIYSALTDKNYRVFFSRISLEDKLGVEYEPYIFAALNSAKIMLVIGTDYEHLNAVWVKNEWSRFLKLMAKDKQKHLVPCYKGIDAYDMPEEFARLQAQDLDKMGAVQDILRGVEKLLPKDSDASAKPATAQQVQTTANPTTSTYLERVFMFLEDGDWQSADEYCEKVLDIDPKNALAYLGKLMAEFRAHKQEDLKKQPELFDSSINYNKIKRYGDQNLISTLESYIEHISERVQEAKKQARIKAQNELNKARSKVLPAQNLICAGYAHTVSLKSDGTVLTTGDNEYGERNVHDWTDIVAVSANSHTVGLKTDGTLVAVGDNEYGQCNVYDWKNITQFSASGWHTAGVRADGTVVAVGNNQSGQCNVHDWTDIVAVSVGGAHTIGLKSNGTAVAVGFNKSGQCNVSEWKDIVAVDAGYCHSVGVKADGTVVAVGENEHGECNVENWTDIVTVATSSCHTVGLKSNGTVVAVGDNRDKQCNVEGWRDIVAISAGSCHTVGLRADGTLIAVGDNENGECNVSIFRLFKNIEALETERKEATAEALSQKERLRLRMKSGVCLHCGGTFKGLITKRCTVCGKEKDY